MSILLGIIVGVAVGWLLATNLRSPEGPASDAVTGGDAEPAAGTDPDASDTPDPASAALEALYPALLECEKQAIAEHGGGFDHPREYEPLSAYQRAVDLLCDPLIPVDNVRYNALDHIHFIGCAAVTALARRSDGHTAYNDLASSFDSMGSSAMIRALEVFSDASRPPALAAPLSCARDWWGDDAQLCAAFRDYLDNRAAKDHAVDYGSTLTHKSTSDLAVIRRFVERLDHRLGPSLIEPLDERERSTVDRTFLNSFGRFWSPLKESDALIEPASWGDDFAVAESTVRASPMRSLLVTGDPRSGKTTLQRLLARRVAPAGWRVFEASAADMMAGQQWFGQLEGRIQQATTELAAAKRMIWYVPDILQFALSGTHQGQSSSILDQVLPAVATGRLVIWTEASPTSAARLLRLRPQLRSIFEILRLEQLESDEAEELAEGIVSRLAASSKVKIAPECIETALASARQYLSAASYPGTGFDLLRLTIARVAKTPGATVLPGDVIQTLSQLSGLPASILDSRERVDLAAVRSYFAARVIGQDEAVDAVVERIAMLKAGLNDPGKPVGVFLFAGPTGTGKTELAKTLAEFLFGSTDRLVRLDMSEFQTADSTVKILGTGDSSSPSDSLITLVRKQPFSVVLLDEFEKAHTNIWDLFLQVFDDGRLTDQSGQVADFRHCIIILTTNLGATSHRTSGLGFQPSADTFTGDQVLRAVSQTFRPEFQNRLDKVIVFRQLTRDLMRGILKKELSRVLERRGLKDREWAVEWEASALEFLLEKGFSPEMGARPLKRAIDQYVIAPLAATIVEKRFPEGDQFVFVKSDGRSIKAEFVDPDADEDGAAKPPVALHGAPLALPAMILAPEGSDAESAALERHYATAEATLASERWEGLKAEIAERMLAEGFWQSPERHLLLSRLALMDRVKAALETASALRQRLAKSADRAGRASREIIGRQALQLHLVNEGIADVFEAAPVEAVIEVEAALERSGEHEAALRWCDELAGMYRAWADARGMQLTEVTASRPRAVPLLVVSGFGAHRLLEREVGLHVHELPETDGGPARVTARVRVAAAPAEAMSADRLRRALTEALDRSGMPISVVRRYRGEPSPLVRDFHVGWRSGRLDAVMRGDFDLIAASHS